MKKTLFTVAVLALATFSGQAYACDQAEAGAAIQKIATSPEYSAKMASATTPESAEEIKAIGEKLSKAGNLMAEQKFDESCAVSKELADTLGVK